MNYKFNTRGGIISTWISLDSYNDRVTIYGEDGAESTETKLYNNADGDLAFTFNEEEILFKNFISVSMAELKKKIEAGEHVFESDLAQSIIHDGMNNVRFAVEMPVPDMILPIGIAVCGGKTKLCECELLEEYLSMPHDKYKIRLQAVNDTGVCRERYYMSDFLTHIKAGVAQILPSVDDGKTPEEHIMEYFCKVTEKDSYGYKMKAEPINA